MLTIRAEQMAAFDAECQKLFLHRLVEHCRRHWPEGVAELGDDLKSFLKEGVERARAYGIEAEQDIAHFVDLSFLWGADFDENPETDWARDVLTDTDLSGSKKIELLLDRSNDALQS